jgi:hypothetical protein
MITIKRLSKVMSIPLGGSKTPGCASKHYVSVAIGTVGQAPRLRLMNH